MRRGPGTLRVVAGTLRGRRFRVPSGEDVRPSGDRVREALFAILAGRVPGARVLDAYAGSGALGIEALSRGARGAVFVERDRSVVGVLRANLRALDLEDLSEIVVADLATRLRAGGLPGEFDIVLADPPYRAYPGAALLVGLERTGALADDAWVVVERDERVEPFEGSPGTLAKFRTARYGHTCLDFYARI